MNHTLIDFEVDASIATITFNRPDKRNAMSDDMRIEFIAALEHVAADKAIKALVLTGAGKGFCAGGDISGMERRMSAPTGEIAAKSVTEDDEVIAFNCDIDLATNLKKTMFDFARHRRPEHYKLIVERTGAEVTPANG